MQPDHRLVRPAAPAPPPPAPAAGSVRHVVSVGSRWDGDDATAAWTADARLRITAIAHDTLTTGPADAVRVAEARVTATLGGDHALADITADCAPVIAAPGIDGAPLEVALAGLLGATVGPGFRSRLARALPNLDAGTPLGQLLDDLPVATLVAGYSRVMRRLEHGVDPATVVSPDGADLRRDLCAGWRDGGRMISSIEAGNGIPYEPLPAAPAPWADEAFGPLPPRGMARRRRIDVVPGVPLVVSAWFRDSHLEPGGYEGAIHEYSVTASVDPDDFTILTIAAVPHVLPYGECPAAVAHVGDLVGAPCAALRRLVPERLTSVRSCTHLNDVLRALADVPALAAHLRSVRA